MKRDPCSNLNYNSGTIVLGIDNLLLSAMSPQPLFAAAIALPTATCQRPRLGSWERCKSLMLCTTSVCFTLNPELAFAWNHQFPKNERHC